LPKHINRGSKRDNFVKKRYNQDVSAEDEWSHITDETKLEIKDPLDVTDRSIFFSPNRQKPTTKQEVVQEKSFEFQDQVRNTNQYLKFVNVLLKERTKDLTNILEKEKKFADELNCLQNKVKTKDELDAINPKYISESDANLVLAGLESECDKIKEKLEYQQSLIEKGRTELQSKRNQINDIKEELTFLLKKQKPPENTDPISLIRQELNRLGVVDQSGNITKALDKLSNKIKS
jgi:hypothetical protein